VKQDIHTSDVTKTDKCRHESLSMERERERTWRNNDWKRW